MTQAKKTVEDLDGSSTKDLVETKGHEDSVEEKKTETEAKEELSEEEEIERDKKILEALGFIKNQNAEKIQYKLNGGDITIGCSFTPHYPKGIVWAKKNGTDALFPDEEVKDLPVIKRFYNIKEGKEQMPELKIAQSQQPLLLQLPGKEKLTLIKDLHYYERDGKMILGKEGELKLAAQAENRVNTEILLEEIEPSKSAPSSIYIRMRGWVKKDDEIIWESVEENNWDYGLETERYLIKQLGKGKITENDIVREEDGCIHLEPELWIKIRSYLADKQKYALRTIIGETKRRLWGEFLGITQSTEAELRIEREEFENIAQKEKGE